MYEENVFNESLRHEHLDLTRKSKYGSVNFLWARVHRIEKYQDQMKALEKLYAEALKIIIQKQASKGHEAIQTIHEKKFMAFLKKNRVNCHSSFWIKNFNVDIFVPSHKLIIELDGGIHNNETKMKKDNYRDDYLKDHFNLPVFHVENIDIVKASHAALNLINSSPPISLKSQRSLLRAIYAETISYQLKRNEIKKLIHNHLKPLKSDEA